MYQDSIQILGIKDKPKEGDLVSCLVEKEGLKKILDKDFHEWSNFDSWESIALQQWIFKKALDLYRGKKVFIKCDCCKSINLAKVDFSNIKNQKCYGLKSAYMIKKVLDEILSAKAMRESDGTYFT